LQQGMLVLNLCTNCWFKITELLKIRALPLGLNLMTNTEIAKVFQDIAELLRFKKDNIFKIRAYEKAAKSITALPVEVEQLVKEDKLREIPGVGEAIAKKITEMVNTGRLQFYERLKAEIAEGKGR
jgi:DNA polymerase (family 10)